jgi:hypothetical protein
MINEPANPSLDALLFFGAGDAVDDDVADEELPVADPVADAELEAVACDPVDAVDWLP